MNYNTINDLLFYQNEIDSLNSGNISYYAQFFNEKNCASILPKIKPYLNDVFYKIFFNYFMASHSKFIPLLADRFPVDNYIDFSFSNIQFVLTFIEYMPDIILSCKKQLDQKYPNTINTLQKSLFYQKIGDLRKDVERLLEIETGQQTPYHSKMLNFIKFLDSL